MASKQTTKADIFYQKEKYSVYSIFRSENIFWDYRPMPERTPVQNITPSTLILVILEI